MTDNPNSIDELRAQLAQPYILEGQAALDKIKGMLDRNEEVRPCVRLLLEVIDTSEYPVVAEKARKILDDWEGLDQMARTQGDQKHSFGVVCPACGFQMYFDKRLVCGGPGSVTLGKAEDGADEILLECQSCREPFVVQINLEGYK